MKNPICFPRWALVACLLGVVTTGLSQAKPVTPKRSLPERTVVMQGRSVSLFAEGASGSVRWQFSPGIYDPWVDVTDDSIYHGAKTNVLEITGATTALNNLRLRFTDTVGGVVVASDLSRLTVSPLLFPSPVGVASNSDGDLIVSDSSTHMLRRIGMNSDYPNYPDDGKDGKPVFELAGASGLAGLADGAGTSARFNQPGGLVWSAPLDLIVADTANSTIRRVRGKTVTTLAGSGSERGNRDGAGSAAIFSDPMGVAAGPDGSFYVADSGNHTIRKIGADGRVGTFAGSPGNAGWVDGAGQAARFNRPTGIAVGADGTVYVSDTVNNLIRKITPAGVVTTLAGVPGVAGTQDGPGDQAMFNGPTGLAMSTWKEAFGSLYVADTGNSTIRAIDSQGKVSTYAGVPTVAGLRDSSGSYLTALFNQPRALFYDGRLFVADTGNAAIRMIASDGGGLTTLPLSVGKEPNAIPAFTPTAPVSGGGVGVSSDKSSSGGGSIGGWLVAALAGAWLLRKFAAECGGERAMELRMTTDHPLFTGAAAPPLRLTSAPRRGRRGSMKYSG